MYHLDIAARPSKWRAIHLWLLTNFLGTGVIAGYISSQNYVASDQPLLVVIGGILALFFSLPAALLLLFGIRWALAATLQASRLLRLSLLLSGSFVIASLIGAWLLSGLDIKALVVIAYATVYLVASILSTFLVYRRWI